MSNVEALKVLKRLLLITKIGAEEESVSEGLYALIAEMYDFTNTTIRENEKGDE